MEGNPQAMLVIDHYGHGFSVIFIKMDVIAIDSLLGWGLGYFGQPHILARFMAADSHRPMQTARRIGCNDLVVADVAGIILTEGGRRRDLSG